MCGKNSAGLSLSFQGQVVLYIQLVQERAKERIIKEMETEKWRKAVTNKDLFEKLHNVISAKLDLNLVDDSDAVEDLSIEGGEIRLHRFCAILAGHSD